MEKTKREGDVKMELKQFDPKAETDVVMEKVLKSKGFVLFVAVLTDKKDKDGNFIIDSHLIRHHYGFEDLAKAPAVLKGMCFNEALGLMGLRKE